MIIIASTTSNFRIQLWKYWWNGRFVFAMILDIWMIDDETREHPKWSLAAVLLCAIAIDYYMVVLAVAELIGPMYQIFLRNMYQTRIDKQTTPTWRNWCWIYYHETDYFVYAYIMIRGQKRIIEIWLTMFSHWIYVVSDISSNLM